MSVKSCRQNRESETGKVELKRNGTIKQIANENIEFGGREGI